MPINHLTKILNPDWDCSGWEKIVPSEKIKSFVEGFYIFSCNDLDKIQLVINDGFPAIIFLPSLNERVLIQTKGLSLTFQTAWVNGGVMKNVYVYYLNKIEYTLVIRFKPYAFYHIFNLPTHFFRNKPVVSLAEINFDSTFLNKIYNEKEPVDRINQMERYIESQVTRPVENALFDLAVQYINNTKGQISVLDVIDKTGVNYKWVERYFISYLGISPKEYIQLQRFIYAYINFAKSPSVDLMEIAISSGYYDYNHFLKDFKSYTGNTPVKYMKTRLPITSIFSRESQPSLHMQQ